MTQIPAAPDAAPSPAQDLRDLELRLVDGVHRGARRPCQDRDVVLAGSGDDCDLVLADADVAPHHALITVLGGGLYIRAMDAPVRLGDRLLQPGDPAPVQPFERIRIGGASLVLGGAADPRWAEYEDAPPGEGERATAAPRPRPPVAAGGLRRLHAMAVVAVLSLASVAIYASVREPAAVGIEDEETRLHRVLAELELGEIDAEIRHDGRIVLHGVVPSFEARRTLERRARQEGIDLDLRDLLTGEQIAQDIREMLRLHGGYTARTRYLGDGRVAVSGTLTEAQMVATLAHPDIEKIPGFVEAVPEGLAGGGEVAAAAPSGNPIVSVVRGDDPYLIAADGSRYYPGATLPDGAHLDSIGQDIWIVRDGRMQRLPLTGARLQARRPAGAGAAATP
ncbi:FHA domain-containing protein [Coralloluteibacterium thermophilus]|uniref:FHA domain-containing protein n=1 Tax=Coralloluteibacterium thermophilum TaxID=2707049 RepID=A0ABV9NSA2_9GAMM